MNPQNRRLALFGVLVAVVFVAGIAVGVISDRLAIRSPGIAMPLIKTPGMSGVMNSIELTPQQRAQAESIVLRRSPRSESLMIELGQQLHAVSDSIDAELRLILTPAQRARLDSLRIPQPQLMIKRQVQTPSGITVDTIFPLMRDSTKRKHR